MSERSLSRERGDDLMKTVEFPRDGARGAASPFHEGERRVQERLGVRESIEPWARKVVRPFLPEQHRQFYARLPFMVVAARDASSRPWATILASEPGLVASPDPRSLHLGALPPRGDALAGGLRSGDDVGLLGIELETRRRNRVNGRVTGRDAQSFALAVAQSFGNCPQYITERRWYRAPAREPEAEVIRGAALSSRHAALIRRADTFFIATGFRGGGHSDSYGMDASHRGGAAGFVRVGDSRRLVFPDYAGNNHFNTLGNLLMDPRVGLLFVDFERGDLLQITGRARIDWGSEAVERVASAQRLVEVDIDEVVFAEGALPIRWETAGGTVRELRVVAKRRESADVTSFVLAARDGGPLEPFRAGQHVPMELHIPGHAAPVRRDYSLSGAPDNGHYRISVKREPGGLASGFLHERVAVGDVVTAGRPRGLFTLDETSQRPVVLIGAGVGVTPLVSMLHSLAARPERAVWLVHGVRDGHHHPLAPEVRRLSQSAAHVRWHIAYSRPGPGDVAGRDYHSEGRVDGALIEQLVPGLEAEFYLCGPTGFMAAIQDDLERRGVATARIHSEAFGPVGAGTGS